jgi:hypothetical protein
MLRVGGTERDTWHNVGVSARHTPAPNIPSPGEHVSTLGALTHTSEADPDCGLCITTHRAVGIARGERRDVSRTLLELRRAALHRPTGADPIRLSRVLG